MATDARRQNGHAKALQQRRKQPSSISFIPAQSDNLAVTSNEAARLGPVRLALRDGLTFLSMLSFFPTIFIPFWTSNPSNEFYLGTANIAGLAVLSFVSVFELVAVILFVPAFLFLPGWAILLVIASGTAFVHLLCWPIQGPSMARSKAPTDPKAVAQQQLLASERWIFLNGCCVTGHMLQQNLDLLASTFGRPVQGIHNRTYGIFGDLVECIIQRAFGFYSEETRVACEYVKAYCTDPQVTKVVLIGHSQGGIMASQVLDELFMDLPSEAVSKLEVYTFGNAASHFNNPLRKMADSEASDSFPTPNSDGSRPPSPHPLRAFSMTAFTSPTSIISPMTPLPAPMQSSADVTKANTTTFSDTSTVSPVSTTKTSRAPTISPYLPKRVIPHIEHYCNNGDMVTRWGALYSAKSILDNRFCGHIFIDEGATGHMLNQHYLEKMFPINMNQHQGRKPSSTFINNVVRYLTEIITPDSHPYNDFPREIPFLDRVVEVDSVTVSRRDCNAAKKLGILRQDSLPPEESTASRSQRSLTTTNGLGNYHDTSDTSAASISSFSRPDGPYPAHTTQQLTKDSCQAQLRVHLGDKSSLKSADLAGAEGTRISVVANQDALIADEEAEQARGKTVRQLSRLWRYMDGGQPDDF